MKDKQWFETWFDSKYYHILYKDRNDTEANNFISKLFEELKIPKKSKVMDLACGKGRHSKVMNELGMNVQGLDLSPNSILIASKMNNESLNFAVHDMREVYKANAFDYIFNLFTSFGYFDSLEENQKVMRSIATQLVKNGKVIIDFLNTPYIIQNLIYSDEKLIDNICFRINKKVEGQHIIKTIEFEDENKNTHTHTEKVQALTLDNFKLLLSATGLQICHIFGDYNLNPYDEETSSRLIIVAQKTD